MNGTRSIEDFKRKINDFFKSAQNKKILFCIILSNILSVILFSGSKDDEALSGPKFDHNLIPMQVPLRVYAAERSSTPVRVVLLKQNRELLCQEAYLDMHKWTEKKSENSLWGEDSEQTNKKNIKLLSVYISPKCYGALVQVVEKGEFLSAYPFVKEHNFVIEQQNKKEDRYEIYF